MKHEKYPGHSGKMLVVMDVEDWIWWCHFLSKLLKADVFADYEAEDLECILRTLNDAEEAEHVAANKYR